MHHRRFNLILHRARCPKFNIIYSISSIFCSKKFRLQKNYRSTLHRAKCPKCNVLKYVYRLEEFDNFYARFIDVKIPVNTAAQQQTPRLRITGL